MAEIKGVYWVAVNPDGAPDMDTIGGSREWAAATIGHFERRTWKTLRKRGWRIAKVKLVEVE